MVTTEEIKRLVGKIEEKDDFEFSVHSRFASQDKQHIICIHRGKASQFHNDCRC